MKLLRPIETMGLNFDKKSREMISIVVGNRLNEEIRRICGFCGENNVYVRFKADMTTDVVHIHSVIFYCDSCGRNDEFGKITKRPSVRKGRKKKR